jgi:Wnt-binding factor required for Wnt secretion
MKNAGWTGVRIESPTFTRAKVLCMTLSALVTFVLLLGIGAGGPKVWQFGSTQLSAKIFLSDGGRDAYGTERHITRANQVFFVESRLARPTFEDFNTTEDISAHLQMQLSVTGDNGKMLVDSKPIARHILCKAGAEFCSWYYVATQDLISTSSYIITVVMQSPDFWEIGHTGSLRTTAPASFTVQTRVWYINSSYTHFEMGWKYFFLIITLLVAVLPRYGYFSGLHSIDRADWTYQQRWVLALLVCLFWFNDPFFAITVYSGKPAVNLGLSGWYILCVLVFIAALMLYWLSLFSDMKGLARDVVSSTHRTNQTVNTHTSYGNPGIESAVRHTARYWLLKVLLVSAITVVNAAAYFYYRYNKVMTPEFTGIDDNKQANTAFGAILAVLMVAYMMWLLVLVATGCCKYVRKLSRGYKFLFALTVLTVVMCCAGVFTAAAYLLSSSGTVFLGFYGLMNVYVWTLAIAYMPVHETSDMNDIGLTAWNNNNTSTTTASANKPADGNSSSNRAYSHGSSSGLAQHGQAYTVEAYV